MWTLLVGLGSYFAGPSIEDFLTGLGAVGAIALVALIFSLWLAGRIRLARLLQADTKAYAGYISGSSLMPTS